jgi:hypothetical protein
MFGLVKTVEQHRPSAPASSSAWPYRDRAEYGLSLTDTGILTFFLTERTISMYALDLGPRDLGIRRQQVRR